MSGLPKVPTLAKPLIAYSSAFILCMVILTWVLGPWYRELDVLFAYSYGGDAFQFSLIAQALVENNWPYEISRLGLPYSFQQYDVPFYSLLLIVIFKFLSFWTDNYAVIVNLFFVLTFPLTTFAALFVFRRFNLPYHLAILGGLLFAFLPFHFQRGESHLSIAAYSLVPIAILIIFWIMGGEPLLFFDRRKYQTRPKGSLLRGIASILYCLLLGLGIPYYSFFTAYFLMIGGGIASLQGKSLKYFLNSIILVGALLLGFFINYLPNLIYFHHHDRNTEAVVRTFSETEYNGLKIIQIVLPVTSHRVNFLAELKERYRNEAPSLTENDMAALGVMGSLGFIYLLAYLIFAFTRTNKDPLLSKLAILNLSAVLLGTVGGLGTIFAFLVNPTLRSVNRISIFIGFFSIFALLILWVKLEKRWAPGGRLARGFVYLSLILTFAFGVWDQTNDSFKRPFAANREKNEKDAKFIQQVEASLPSGSMIFQFPIMEYPEIGPINKIGTYDPLIPYFHSKKLKWSFGAIPGRKGLRWQKDVVQMRPDLMLKELKSAGFIGIYIDRFGYEDQGSKIEGEITKFLKKPPIISGDGRLAFYPLQ